MYVQQSIGKTCRHTRNNKFSWGLSCWSSRKRQRKQGGNAITDPQSHSLQGRKLGV